MSTESIKGLVISENFSGEADKYITILTENEGKVTLLARGARKPWSKIMSSAGLFNYGEFFYFKGRGFNSLNSADITEGFYEIQKDYEKLAYASFVLETADKTAYGDTGELLRLVLYTLTAMAKTDIEPKIIACAYRFKLLDIMGFLNVEDNCLNCGKEETDFYSVLEGGFVCRECRRNFLDSVMVSQGAKKAIRYIAESDMKKIFSFRVSDEVYRELESIGDRGVRLHISRQFKTDKILNTL